MKRREFLLHSAAATVALGAGSAVLPRLALGADAASRNAADRAHGTMSLEISIHCLCLFVPEPEAGIVHVLMPVTHGIDQHVVRLVHSSSPATGISLQGWALQLGGARASADTTLQPQSGRSHGETIVDLTPVAGPLSRQVLRDGSLAARIELRSGGVRRLESGATWEFGGDRVAMASQVTWSIPGITDADVVWTRLGDGSAERPVGALSDLADGGGRVRLAVYHVAPEALPPCAGGRLAPEAVRAHFRAFYDLYGFDPRERHLPSHPRSIGGPRTERALDAGLKADGRGYTRLASAEMGAGVWDALTRPERGAVGPGKTYDCPTSRGSFAPQA